ncbi:MAG: hypothetical protein QXJ07_02385 [Candidatus Bathyarchaeia archaeon]
MKFKHLKNSGLKGNRKAVSPAISMIIITAITIVLVLVAGNYAYQVLERQRAFSEFDAVNKSFMAFDDAVRDIAWEKGGTRYARFTLNYGVLEVIPAGAVKGLSINLTVEEYPNVNYTGFTGYIRYNLSTRYITFGNGYKSYLFGDNKTIISRSVENFGTALIEQRSSWVSLTLYYRVKVSRTSVVEVGNDIINYVEILIIKITSKRQLAHKGNIDLTARNQDVTTKSYGPYDAGNNCTVSVSIGGLRNTKSVDLTPGKVVFNMVVSEIWVGA